MRTWEERKAEVFCRSERRAQARKRKRKRILTLCVPLCLLLVAAASFFPPPNAKETVQVTDKGAGLEGGVQYNETETNGVAGTE